MAYGARTPARTIDLQIENVRLSALEGSPLSGLLTRDPGMLKICRTIEKLASALAGYEGIVSIKGIGARSAAVLLAGIGGGVGAAFGLGQVRTSYATAAKLERASGLPVWWRPADPTGGTDEPGFRFVGLRLSDEARFDHLLEHIGLPFFRTRRLRLARRQRIARAWPHPHGPHARGPAQ